MIPCGLRWPSLRPSITSRPNPRNMYYSRNARRKNSEHAMALTATAKEELARVPVTRLSERFAEVVGILRFGGGLQLLPGRLIIETELDHEGTARRLRSTLRDTFSTEYELMTLNGSSSRR